MSPVRRWYRTTSSCQLLLGSLLLLQGSQALAASEVRFHAVTLATATQLPLQTDERALQLNSASFAAFEQLQPAAELQQAIQQLELGGEHSSPQLAELAFELGKALHAEGRYRDASKAYERAWQLLRQQAGLQAASQIPLLQARIESLLAMQDPLTADQLQQQLLDLQERHHADDALALAEARLAWADWNIRYYLELQSRRLPGGRTDVETDALNARLGQAFRYYHQGLALLEANDGTGIDEWKIEVERRIAALTLMANREHQRHAPTLMAKHGMRSRQAALRSNNEALVEHGSSALQRAIDYSVEQQDAAAVALRTLELGDWYLLVHDLDAAHARYAEAAALLQQAGLPAEAQTQLLQPGLPVHDPVAELQAQLQQQDAAGYEGFIDVSFTVDHSGRALAPRIVANSSDDPALERQLLRRIRNESFRPLAGADKAASEVTLRYFFTR
jgi:TonB family protein